jgi:phage head maturation protease
MPAALDRCVQKVMKQGKSKSSAFAICTAQFKKAGKKFKDSDEQLFFEHNAPIKQSLMDTNDFMIEGIAINETTTSNGHKFIAEELKKAAPSLMNVPLLKDHNNSVDAIIGRVQSAEFDEGKSNIPFRAKVNDNKIQELIKRGDLNTVSVGASVDPTDIEELEDGSIIPRNITFKELSVVAVPADAGATFDVSLKEAYNNWKESYSNDIVVDTELEGGQNDIMSEEETKPEEVESEEVVEEPVEEPKEVVEEKVDVEKLVAKAVAEAMKNLKEADVDEVPVEEPEKVEEPEEPKEEEKDDVDEVAEELEEGYKIEQGHGSLRGSSFTVIRNKY